MRQNSDNYSIYNKNLALIFSDTGASYWNSYNTITYVKCRFPMILFYSKKTLIFVLVDLHFLKRVRITTRHEFSAI